MNIDKTIILPEVVLDKYNSSLDLYMTIVTKAGFYNKFYNHSIKRDGIDESIIIYCIDGEGWLEINNIRIIITAGDIIYLDKNVPHSYGSNDNNPWTIYWLHFCYEKSNIISETSPLNNKFIKTYIGHNNSTVDFFKTILSLLELDVNSHIMLQCTSYLNLILCSIVLVNNNNYKKPYQKKEYINKVIKFLEDNIYNQVTLEEVSTYVGLSKYHFSREFKKATSYTPIEYFNRIKIQTACNLLISTDLTVTEISYKLSYTTPYYFSKYFKDLIGFSPSQYRKTYNSYY